MNRRTFLKSLTLPVPAIALGGVLMPLLPGQATAKANTNGSHRRVILIELAGANDGLNTVIPYTDERYRELRPTLGLSAGERIELSGEFALHHALKPLADVWEDGDCAIVHGLGYPAPNRSHFSSIQLWETGGDGLRAGRHGWVTDALEQQFAGQRIDAHGIALDARMGVFSSPKGIWLSMSSAGQYAGESIDVAVQSMATVERRNEASDSTGNAALDMVLSGQRILVGARHSIAEKMRKRAPSIRLSGNPLSEQLGHAANLIAAGVDAPVYKVSLGGFDTHESQAWRHRELLGQLANALVQFRHALKSIDQWDDTLVMTYSEFGRRAQENRSGGTDHGTAAPHIVMGGRVNGGFFGEHPSLGQLVNGDLPYSMDYRAVYERILNDWLNVSAGRFAAFSDPRLSAMFTSRSG